MTWFLSCNMERTRMIAFEGFCLTLSVNPCLINLDSHSINCAAHSIK